MRILIKNSFLGVILFFCSGVLAQEVPPPRNDCGTPVIDRKEMEKRIYYGNNNRLIDIARQSGFDIPADYFDRIDKNGNYKGRSYKARDFSRKLGKGRGRLLRPQDPPGGSFRDEPFAMISCSG